MELKQIIQEQFPQFTEEDLIDEMSDVSHIEEVSRGEILIDFEEEIKFLPLIYKGAVRVHREDEDGREILLYYLEQGNTCASSLTCCMSNKKSNIRAEAEEDVSFISIPIEYLDIWLVKYPSWKEFIMNTYATRFEELLKTVDELAFNKLDERLLSYLKEKSKISGNSTLEISHRQIAYDLNSSREVISRLLKQLERTGNIRLGRGKIELINI